METSMNWICKVCGGEKNPLANCRIERKIPSEKPHMCPWQSFDKKGNKDTVPAKWEKVE